MKKKFITSAVIIVTFIALVYSQSAAPSFMIEFITLGVNPIDLKSANLLDEVNAIQLEGISADQNVAAGMYEIASAIEWFEPDPEHIRATENALGVRIAVDPRTQITFGQKQFGWRESRMQLSNEDPILRRYLKRHEKTLDQLLSILERPVFANFYYSPDQERENLLWKVLRCLTHTSKEYAGRTNPCTDSID